MKERGQVAWEAWCKALEPMTPEAFPERVKPLFATVERAIRNAALEEASRLLATCTEDYQDGPSMHVENMTLARAVIKIRAMIEELK